MYKMDMKNIEVLKNLNLISLNKPKSHSRKSFRKNFKTVDSEGNLVVHEAAMINEKGEVIKSYKVANGKKDIRKVPATKKRSVNAEKFKLILEKKQQKKNIEIKKIQDSLNTAQEKMDKLIKIKKIKGQEIKIL